MGHFGKIILGLDNSALQKVLFEMDKNTLLDAICFEDKDVKKKIYGNISARLSNLLKYEIKEFGCIFNLVKNSQKKIVSIINHMAEIGLIIITPEISDEIKQFQQESSSEQKQANSMEKEEKSAEEERNVRIKSFEDVPPELSPDIKLYLSKNITIIPDHTPLFYSDYVCAYHKIIKISCDISQKALMEGRLALEEAWDQLPKDFIFKIGLRLVVHGTDAASIQDILFQLIEHETDHYRKILKRMVLEAVLSIQAGDNPLFIIQKLNSMANIKDDPVTATIADYFMSEGEDALNTLLDKIAKIETPEQKADDTEIVRFIKRAFILSEVARRDGLLGLGKLVMREKGRRDIFEYGISLLIDQYDIKFIEKILANLVYHETEPAMKTLALIKKEAVLSIAAGDNPQIFGMRLVSLYKGNFENMDVFFDD